MQRTVVQRSSQVVIASTRKLGSTIYMAASRTSTRMSTVMEIRRMLRVLDKAWACAKLGFGSGAP